MADFDPTKHCPPDLQAIAGLFTPQFKKARQGQKTQMSTMGHNYFGVASRVSSPTKAQAILIWDNLDPNWRDDPAEGADAVAIAYIATCAGKEMSEDAMKKLPNPKVMPPLPMQMVGCPGGYILELGQDDAAKFISFYVRNSQPDANLQITKFGELSGEEQNEWIRAWVAADKVWGPSPNHVKGLAGTNIAALEAEQLRTAVKERPSIRKRPRPDNAAVAADQWATIVRPPTFWDNLDGPAP